MAIKNVSIRIDEEVLKKITYVANYEGRSINSHVIILIRKSIENFENEHGVIDGELPSNLNAKVQG